MAQVFNNAVLTDAGAALLARSQVEEFPVKFTRVATGNGIHQDKSIDALKQRTSLIAQKQTFSLSSISQYSNTQVKVTAVLSNQGLVTGYYMNEIALFAQAGDDSTTEVMYSIAVAGTDNSNLFPAYNGYSPLEIIQSFVVTTSNTANVEIVMSSDAYALASDLADHEEEIVMSEAGAHGIRFHSDTLEVYDPTQEEWKEIETGGTVPDTTDTTKGINKPDNVSIQVNSGVYNVNGAVIPSYERTGQTAFTSTWLSLTSGGAALTPDTKQMYRIMNGDYAEKLFYWNGTAYKPIASGGSFKVCITAADYAGQTVTLTNGTDAQTATLSVLGIADFIVTSPGTYTASVGGTQIGSVRVGEYDISVDRTIVYGFHLDATKSDPAQMISYNVQYNGVDVENKNYTAAAVNLTTGVMDPGSWNLTDDFFVPRSCMLKYDGTVDYYLKEDDETKKADGTASDVANTSYGGNAMMEWGRNGQKIYLKIVPDATATNGATFYVSNKKADNGFHDYNFYDCDGHEIDHFYTPKYCGSLVDSKLRSISGQAPCNNKTGQNEVDYAAANNVNNKTEWDTETWGDRTLINILLLMIGKNCNTQAVFGEGYTTGGSSASSLANAGTLNGKGQWYGSSTNNDKTKGVKIFGMEHWWGNIWRRVRGLLNISGTVKYKLTYSQIDGTTQNGYDATGSGYKSVANGTPGGTNGGYANVAVFNKDGIYLKTASGSETTYFCNGLWFNNSQSNYAFVGGACGNGSHCGALCVNLGSAFSFTDWGNGAALSCKPLAA